uniref:Reverse transcriptase domain-containing protein n=1 Tax=Tanacetum cinerariifolium TaxID=118510 RepID=A0A6L2J302_TANCI|nr:hypothetical protein [Tanacetum cinerariifolium]
MIEKNFIEIEGTFLVRIRDNLFKRMDGENVFDHINGFLEVVELLKVRGLSHDRFRPSVLPISLSGAASEWFSNECVSTISIWDAFFENFVQKFYNLFDHNEEEEVENDDNPDEIDDVPKIFKIEDGLFNFDTPLCITFEEFDYLLKIDPDLFTYDVQEIKTLVIDGYCNGGKLPGMKVNTDDVCPFTRWNDHLQRPYTNAKPKWTFDHYLNNYHKHDGNYEANNGGNIQRGQKCMENLTHEPSACKIRRFEMTKYTFEADEEFVAIKELEHINRSETNMDARRAYQELFRKIDDGWLVTRTMDE